MIPKIIHYCWFGRNPLPKLALKCIDSWHKFLPDYEIKEWNEDNFNVDAIPYTASAYKAGKYAFVSDYARYHILYNEGGIYFDTDVELIKPLDDIVSNGPFFGIEKNRNIISINPGLVMGACQKMEFYRRMLDLYDDWDPVDNDMVPEPLLIQGTTDLLISGGFERKDEMQHLDGITIYPNDFFNPLDDYTGRLGITQNTRSIHHYAKSWIDGYGPMKNWLSKRYHRLLNLLSKTD
ncbi:MAG: glycosyl transferase [Muribaculaceae bacterium]|nr:glycosyl transferase [Muribaculaceae bacterium]